MTKEETTVASERVAEILAEKIHSGELQPGDRIMQDHLASKLNVSRIPVRDALRMLQARGLVTVTPNLGARVASLTVRDMEVSYRIREQLEPMLLAESIPNLSSDDISEMGRIKTQLEAASNVDEYMPLSQQFHWTAFRGHNAPLLAQIVERLWDTTHSYRRAYAKLALRDTERREIMRKERELLFGAIERREVDLAQGMLGLHIRRTHLALRDYDDLPDLG